MRWKRCAHYCLDHEDGDRKKGARELGWEGCTPGGGSVDGAWREQVLTNCHPNRGFERQEELNKCYTRWLPDNRDFLLSQGTAMRVFPASFLFALSRLFFSMVGGSKKLAFFPCDLFVGDNLMTTVKAKVYRPQASTQQESSTWTLLWEN
jgi:hypothetical protein